MRHGDCHSAAVHDNAKPVPAGPLLAHALHGLIDILHRRVLVRLPHAVDTFHQRLQIVWLFLQLPFQQRAVPAPFGRLGLFVGIGIAVMVEPDTVQRHNLQRLMVRAAPSFVNTAVIPNACTQTGYADGDKVQVVVLQ